MKGIYRKAVALRDLGRAKEALQALKTGLKEEPENEQVGCNLSCRMGPFAFVCVFVNILVMFYSHLVPSTPQCYTYIWVRTQLSKGMFQCPLSGI